MRYTSTSVVCDKIEGLEAIMASYLYYVIRHLALRVFEVLGTGSWFVRLAVAPQVGYDASISSFDQPICELVEYKRRLWIAMKQYQRGPRPSFERVYTKFAAKLARHWHKGLLEALKERHDEQLLAGQTLV